MVEPYEMVIFIGQNWLTISIFFRFNFIMSVRVLQRNRSHRMYIDIKKEIDFEELAHAIMEATSSAS